MQRRGVGRSRLGSTALGALAFVVASAVAASASAQGIAAADSALLQRMLVAEDSRASDSVGLAPLYQGLRSSNGAVRRVAVRALGRLESITALGPLRDAMDDPSADVRAEAANALGQIAQAAGRSASNPGGPDATSTSTTIVGLIRGLSATEKDPRVVGALARTLGRLPYPSADAARIAADAIAGLAPLGSDGAAAGTARSREPWLGVALGIDDLLRRFPVIRGAPSVVAVASMPRRQPADGGVEADAWSRETNVVLASIRGRLLAAAPASPNALDSTTASRVRDLFIADLADSDPQVRRQVVVLAATAAALDEPTRERIVDAALRDRSFSVRLEGVRAYARRRGASCGPLVAATRDDNAHVALAAIDALGATSAPCEPSSSAVERLAELTAAPPPRDVSRTGTRGSWHPGAHALVSLARVAPERARPAVARLVTHPVWQVRMYAARAAGALADTATLIRLASDREDNVRDAAVTSLTELVRPPTGSSSATSIARTDRIDSVFTAQLARRDYQLVLDAAKALDGARSTPRVVSALLASLDRISAERRENSRDPRMELLARLETLGGAEHVARLTPYLSDFDSAIAARAAQVLRRWGQQNATATSRPLPYVAVNLAEVSRMHEARIRITMAPQSGGGSFEMRLLVDEAPATILRLAALIRRGYYNGLTFHRIAPNFVIQGGSPRANEYVGADRFMRDELGLPSHERGTLGISTRGRDTGDAQIFVNLIDNWRLDHDYTVFAEVVRGMNVVDAILEGDVMSRVEIVGAR